MITPLPPSIAALAAWGTATDRVLPSDGWDGALSEVAAHGLLGILGAAHRAGAVDLEPSAADRLQQMLEVGANHEVRLEAELIRLAPLLERHQGVVIKGAVLAHAAYPNPEWRPFTDLDLLFPARLLPAVVERLLGMGYHRPRPDPSPAFMTRVGKATALEHPSGLVVDLHRTLVAGSLGEHIDIDGLLADRIQVEVTTSHVPAPAWDAHLIEVSLHAVVGDGLCRALSQRDVVQVTTHPLVTFEAVRNLADRWDVSRAVATGLHACHQALGVDLPPGFTSWCMEVGSDPTLLEPLATESRSARRRLDELRQGGFRRRIALARSLVAPDPEFLRWKYGQGPLAGLYRRRWAELIERRRDGLGSS